MAWAKMMVNKLLADKRGMALLITLMVISLLVAVIFQFSRDTRQEYFSSSTMLSGQKLAAVARSGISIGKALLEADKNINSHDTLSEKWATLSNENLPGLFSQGGLEVSIIDYSGKIYINNLVDQGGGAGGGDTGEADSDKAADSDEADEDQQGEVSEGTGEGEEGGGSGGNQTTADIYRVILMNLLRSGSFGIDTDEEAEAIIDCIVDWVDSDDSESPEGAESSYYLSQNPPYEARNGPVPVIEELLLVKNITPELLFGTDSRPGLADYLTIYGYDSKININTADAEIIQAMGPDDISDELLEDFDAFRRDETNEDLLSTPNWYQNNIPGWPGYLVLPTNIISTTSYYFEISSNSKFHDQQKTVSSVVLRDPNGTTKVIYQKME